MGVDCHAHVLDYGHMLECVERWIPDARDRDRVLGETPTRLFGSEAS